ncbi:MAG: HAD-IA family hydrolase [Candidatus Diapherotrites archaeon]
MKKKEKIKAIVFDVGGVLALGNNSRWKKGKICVQAEGVHADVARKLGISLDQYLDSIDTNYALAIEGKTPKNKVMNILSKNLKVSKKKLTNLYIDSYKRNFALNKQLFKQAFELKKKGYKIGVLSDQWFLSQKALMPKKLYSKFDVVLISCEQKMRKPNPAFYKLLIKKLKTRPSEILFIDNQIWNIKPAKKLYLKTIVFKSNYLLFKNKLWGRLFL